MAVGGGRSQITGSVMGGRHPKAYLEESESIYKTDVLELMLF